MQSIQSEHDVTHIPTRGVSRDEVLKQIAALPKKSFTFVCMVSETQPLNPLDRTLFGSLDIECFCKVGAGYDSIDVEYFTSKGTWVANAPNAVRIPTAEYCVSLILATVKGLGVADKNVRQEKWRDGLGFQSNIQGMTLGIVGLGAIGKVFILRCDIESNVQEVVKRMSGWGVKVIYSNHKSLPKDEEERLGNARHVSIPELLSESDIISLHCPLTPETQHLLNRETLSQCKKGVFIINTSRGPVIDERALIEALNSGQVKRAGLDVFEREPQLEQQFLGMENVVLSPHYAAFTHECSKSLRAPS
jgi:glyoxylate reductase